MLGRFQTTFHFSKAQNYLGQNWVTSGMSGHVRTCLQRESSSICVFHHYIIIPKYYLKWSSGSWDIQIWKIEQSDWARAFRSITREPDFSQTFSFPRMIENHNKFDFRTLRTNISWINFLLKCKIPIFAPFLALLAQNQNFPEKSGFVTF